ncbi:MAG: gliding motility-associated C-terminal domain-containing protein [Bacteroidetes bacterium]|nr:gliding motility-associated C-terminal domain-containing protein [Bacteroidota bacterium]
MQKQFSRFCILAVMCFLSVGAFATHIVGGELNYKYLGGNKYEIRVTIFRDACVGQVGFDDPASLGVFDVNNNLVLQKLMSARDSGNVPPIIYDPCTDVPVFFCYKYCHYIDTVTLPPLAGGYQLVYQRCCRNQNILNLINPQNVGATYTAFIPGPEVVAVNSNPIFQHPIPPFVCVNKPFTFDNSAIDPDGDSLVYELFTPFDGASAAAPMPQPPNNPPYVTVPWQSPYSTANMLGGVALTVNSSTGLVSATPNTLGYFVVGLKVKEYRAGVLLSETRRDYQIIVKDCPSVVVAAAQAPQAICGTTNVSFTNNSTGSGGLGFNWYFGDPSTNADTSHVTSPTYTYPGTGTYTVTLVAYVASKPQCNDTVHTTVAISNAFKGAFTFTPVPCSENMVEFHGSVQAPPGTTPLWQWNFGDNGTDTIQDPMHHYTGQGTYIITLVTYIPNSLGCYDTLQAQTINVITNPELYIPNTFTPNNDGFNDVFRVRGPAFGVFYFAVYNRWGQMMFETQDPSQGWDGMFNGKPCDPGVFGYYIKARCSENSDEIFKKGNVTLVR